MTNVDLETRKTSKRKSRKPQKKESPKPKSERVNKGGGRPRKDVKYRTERQETLDKLNDILEITETKNSFCSTDLDSDQEKVDRIMSLKPDVEKYFGGKELAVFKNEYTAKPYLGLIRIIYNSFGKKLIRSTVSEKKDGQAKRKSIYYILLK